MLREGYPGNRLLSLRRRRSRLPWIYLVYQQRPKPQGKGGVPFPFSLSQAYSARRKKAGTSNADSESGSMSPASLRAAPPCEGPAAGDTAVLKSSAGRRAIDKRAISAAGATGSTR